MAARSKETESASKKFMGSHKQKNTDECGNQHPYVKISYLPKESVYALNSRDLRASHDKVMEEHSNDSSRAGATKRGSENGDMGAAKFAKIIAGKALPNLRKSTRNKKSCLVK